MFIALTGGIGCGKSAALQIFAECGLQTADSDRICHEFYQTTDGIAAVAARWPQAVGQNGAIDRKKLGNIVFRSEDDLHFLEELVTPYLMKRLQEFKAAASTVIVEVPLLFEKNLADLFDKTVAVWSPFELRRERLATRNWDHAECSRRERLQWSPEKKLAAADYGIINSGSLEFLRGQCQQLAESFV
ncbi:MAG: dephospho-CoA kinase [Lentisphaerae bacterium]|nr:dephospho-CoA kinase [Lentisphaerota bacterium]